MDLSANTRSFFAAFALLLVGSSASYSADGVAVKLPNVIGSTVPAYVSSQFIFPVDHQPTIQSHASSICETPDGILVAWFGGDHESHPNVSIWTSRLTSDGWSLPTEVAKDEAPEAERQPAWNPVLFQPKDGPLMLFYKLGPSPSRWWGMLKTSNDYGRTWSEPVRLGDNDKVGSLVGPVKNAPIQLADGTILCPSSTEHRGWKIHFEVSKDLGKTWEVICPLEDEKVYNAIQPAIIQHDANQLQVLCRSRENVIVQSWSQDEGKTWTPLSPINMPNPNASVDAVSLKDDRKLLVYNHTLREGDFPANRTMLNVAISADGQSWHPVLTLERQPGEYSYPSVLQSADGLVHITYTYRRTTIKHVVIDPAKLKIPAAVASVPSTKN